MATEEDKHLEKDGLIDSSEEELVAHILELQEQLQQLDGEVSDLRESLQFILNVQAGITEKEELLQELDSHSDSDGE